MRKTLFWSGIFFVCLACLWAVAGIFGHEQAQALPGKTGAIELVQLSAGSMPKVDKNFGRMSLYFIPNQGQMDARVSYYIQGRDKSIYFGPGQVTFSLSKPAEKPKEKVTPLADRPRGRDAQFKPSEHWTIRLEFVGADEKITPVAEDKTGAVISYFKGKPENWKTGLPTYSRIVYRNLWPGIDLAYSGTVNQLKYEFIVHPGADPANIRLRYKGAEQVEVNSEGALEVMTPVASFQDEKPVAWQDIGGLRKDIEMSYDLAPETKTTGGEKTHNFRFKVGSYDSTQELVLDPATIVYCGYIGGDANDSAHSIAVDDKACAYVCGTTESTETTFPVNVGPDLTYTWNEDAFVAKVDAKGTGLIYCGYIGGNGDDGANGCALDSNKRLYVTGVTGSDETSFPVRGGLDKTFNGVYDAFVAMVNPLGTGLIYCGYIGGSCIDQGHSIAVDALGAAYVVGSALSDETTFPVKIGPDLTFNGGHDAFVAKITPLGKTLAYCGYIGGNDWDFGAGIALDSEGCAYVCGYAASTEATFPIKGGPFLFYSGGTYDAFIAKVRSTGTDLIYCGYIGGSGADEAQSIVVEGSKCAYIGGTTESAETSFPVKVGPDLTFNGGLYDGFVAKVNAFGNGLIYCGYIGGLNPYDLYQESARIGAVDSAGCAYVSGVTGSDETTFPVKGGPDLTYNGKYDGYVAKVASSGASLLFCSYIGGSGDDGCILARDPSGSLYLAGHTESDETTFPVLYGPDISYNGKDDAFVAKIYLTPEVTLVTPVGYERWVVGSTKKIEWTTDDSKGNNKIEYSTNKGQTWSVIALATPDDCSYSWTIPNKPSVACLIRITQKESGQYDQSDQPFAIVPKPKITVVSPNGGESWGVYSQQTIQWTTAGIVGNVKIEYSKNGGTSWLVVVASTPNTGSYMWVVPNTPSKNCLVRIKEAADGSPMDKSNAPFKILLAAD